MQHTEKQETVGALTTCVQDENSVSLNHDMSLCDPGSRSRRERKTFSLYMLDNTIMMMRID